MRVIKSLPLIASVILEMIFNEIVLVKTQLIRPKNVNHLYLLACMFSLLVMFLYLFSFFCAS